MTQKRPYSKMTEKLVTIVQNHAGRMKKKLCERMRKACIKSLLKYCKISRNIAKQLIDNINTGISE